MRLSERWEVSLVYLRQETFLILYFSHPFASTFIYFFYCVCISNPFLFFIFLHPFTFYLGLEYFFCFCFCFFKYSISALCLECFFLFYIKSPCHTNRPNSVTETSPIVQAHCVQCGHAGQSKGHDDEPTGSNDPNSPDPSRKQQPRRPSKTHLLEPEARW